MSKILKSRFGFKNAEIFAPPHEISRWEKVLFRAFGLPMRINFSKIS